MMLVSAGRGRLVLKTECITSVPNANVRELNPPEYLASLSHEMLSIRQFNDTGLSFAPWPDPLCSTAEAIFRRLGPDEEDQKERWSQSQQVPIEHMAYLAFPCL